MHAEGVNTVSARGKILDHANSLSANMIESWSETMSQFRQIALQCATMFFDVRYKIFRRLSSLVNDSLFFCDLAEFPVQAFDKICRLSSLKSSFMMFVISVMLVNC